MTKEEQWALFKAGVIIGKINYDGATNAVLLPQFLLRFDWKSFPSMQTFDEVFYNTACNHTVLVYNGKYIGLDLMSTWDKNDKRIDTLSYSLNHPASEYWGSILKPIWDRQNEGKCKTCHGTGWDGIGYILTCVDCGGTGKIKLLKGNQNENS